MTTRPTRTPDWATSVSADVTQPPAVVEELGWVQADPPRHDYDNDFKKLVSEWLQWLSGPISGAITGTDDIANNRASATNLLDGDGDPYTFDPASYGAVVIEAHVRISATTPLRSLQRYTFIWNGSSWDSALDETGAATSVELSLTAAGVLQYTSANYTGYTAGQVSFLARTFNL